MEKTRSGNVKVIWNSTLEEVNGDSSGVTGIRISNSESKHQQELKIHGVFIAIGHTPNTELFVGQLAMKNGYIVTITGIEGNATATSIPGVFAAGDIQDHVYRQAVTSAGTGCMAALDTQKYLDQISENAIRSETQILASRARVDQKTSRIIQDDLSVVALVMDE